MAAAPAPAAGSGTGKRKRPLSEDDVYLLLHRYAPGTILTALQEVAQHADGRRIDWRAVVAKSATGITSAREFQMLWRHFAYQHDLDETVDAGDQPLGDDSDLELEVEPVPNPTNEALSEASALAKALISGSSREQASGQRVNLDAPDEKIARVPSEKQLAQSHRITNVMGPVSNSKQASHLGPSPGSLDPNGPSKKKKKPKAWSKEEDADLTAGVQKYGEGNWDYIFHKCKFDNTRTPDQLSQRWTLICKRPGGSTKPANAKHATVASSEARKDCNKALSMAVGPIRRPSMLRPGAHQQGIQHKSTVFAPKIPEVRSAAAPSPALAMPVPVPVPVPVPMPLPVKVQIKSPLPLGQQAPVQRAPPKSANASNKTRKKQAAQPNPTIGTSSIQAAAIAAGGRLAPALAAANFLKVASAHIRSQVTGSSKSSASPKAPSVVVEPGTQPGSIQHLEPLNTSAAKSGPSISTKHATDQVHGASEVAVVNPPGPSSGADLLEAKKALTTIPVPGSCDSEEKEDDSTFCVITIDDLFPEDAKQPETVDLMEKQSEIVDQKANQPVETVGQRAKQPETVAPQAKQPETADPQAKQPETADPKAKQPDTLNPKVEMVDPKDKDMLEFDQFVASQGAGVNTDHMDKSKTGRSASQAQGLVGSQKKQVKLVPTTVGKGNPVSAGAPATMKRTKTPVPPHLANQIAAGSPRGIVGTVNANAPNKTLVRKAATPVPAGVQAPPLKKQATNSRGNQVMQPSTAVVGFGVPASSQAIMAMNGASKANPPSSSSQASAAVNIGNKVNPPPSGQASAAVNIVNKANPPSSSQASAAVNIVNKANPPSSSQASAVVNIVNKANPPSSGQASAAVNIVNKANPPSSGQASTAVNIGNKANPPSNGQASAAVNVGSKANPPSSGLAHAAVNLNGANRVTNQPSSSQASASLSGAANKAKANPPDAPKQ